MAGKKTLSAGKFVGSSLDAELKCKTGDLAVRQHARGPTLVLKRRGSNASKPVRPKTGPTSTNNATTTVKMDLANATLAHPPKVLIKVEEGGAMPLAKGEGQKGNDLQKLHGSSAAGYTNGDLGSTSATRKTSPRHLPEVKTTACKTERSSRRLFCQGTGAVRSPELITTKTKGPQGRGKFTNKNIISKHHHRSRAVVYIPWARPTGEAPAYALEKEPGSCLV